MLKRLPLLLCLALMIVPMVAAQTCPADVLRAISRAGAACTDVERNEACYGNGTVSAVFQGGDASLDLPGERAAIDRMAQLIISPDDEYSIAMMQLQASLLETQPGRNLLLLAFGDVTLTNQVPVRPTLRVTSTGTLNIRTLPDDTADIIQQLPLRTSVTANGITADGAWLRVEVPNTSDIGWTSRSVFDATLDVRELNIVDVDTPYLRPFQVMTLLTAYDDAPCMGAPESGVLLQAPNAEDEVNLTINGAEIRLAGTAFVQSASDIGTVLNQIDGFAVVTLNGETRYLVGGASLTIAADGTMGASTAYDSTDLVGLPVNNLNYRVRIPAPIAEDDLASAIAALMAEPTPAPDTTRTQPEYCTRMASTRITLYAGPATFHEVIRTLNRGTRLYPVLSLSDSSGNTWWQLSNGHWVESENVVSTGPCDPVPITEVVAPPTYNFMTLERCDTTNGPIRAGQWVIFEFTDGGWETYEEALNAPRVGTGRITVGQQWLWVDVSNPREVAEDRWYRTWSAVWYAEPGTYRIVGNRLHYTVICDVTVPLG